MQKSVRWFVALAVAIALLAAPAAWAAVPERSEPSPRLVALDWFDTLANWVSGVLTGDGDGNPPADPATGTEPPTDNGDTGATVDPNG